MFERRIPEYLRHPPVPSINGLATLAAIEAVARGLLTSVYPLVVYRSLGSAQTVSEAYLMIGIVSMAAALLTPWTNRLVPRRYLYTAACLTMFIGNLAAATNIPWLILSGLAANTIAVAVLAVCFNAYVMDYVERSSLGKSETRRLFFSGAAWTVGPFLGVWLMDIWQPAPFFLSCLATIILLAVFWYLRLGNGKQIARARGPAANPLGYLPRFIAQPRLVAGWIFAVIRSCGWWAYVVYLPIYAVEQGFSDQLGGIALSLTNALLFVTPFMLRFMQFAGVRLTVITGFCLSGLAFCATVALTGWPLAVLVCLFAGSAFLILLDVSAGLPFLMAVKPSERTEMSAVYSTFRDVSGVLSPAAARVILTFAPLIWVFAACGFALIGCGALALKLHHRLGNARLVQGR